VSSLRPAAADGDVVTAALEHYRRHPRLDFSDCLVVEIARQAGHLPVGTFDRRLTKLDGVQKIQL
jgi:predicted nucleic acid-binding protein